MWWWISDRDAAELRRMRQKLDGVKGAKSNTPRALVFAPGQQPPEETTFDDPGRFLFPVLVKSNGGSDGTSSTRATWAYDLYALGDTTYQTKLNTTGGARQPKNSPARIQFGSVTKASDGSDAMGYYDKDGAIQLWSCQEVRADPQVCS